MFWRKKRKRKRIGLALGGGSVRGTVHLGVQEVLEQHLES